MRFHVASAQRRDHVFRLRLGDYYSGTRSDYRGELNWRPSRYFTASTAYELRNIRLAEGDFETEVDPRIEGGVDGVEAEGVIEETEEAET